jgi:hypothetical protein
LNVKVSLLLLKNRVGTIGFIFGLAAMATCGCAGPHQFGGAHSRWLEGLPAADRAKLHALREAVKNDPAVRAARDKRKRANDEFHEALRAAILKRDPSVAPLLDKIRKQREEREKAKMD